LYKNKEIPVLITNHSKYSLQSFNGFNHQKFAGLNTGNSISSDLRLIMNEAEIISYRFRHSDKINLFQFSGFVFYANFPLIINFLQNRNLNSFTTISDCRPSNLESFENLKKYCSFHKYKLPLLEEIFVEPDWTIFKEEVNKTIKKVGNGTNIFSLSSSWLGNYSDPQNLLTNIYNSIPNNGYLIIVQYLYRGLNENQVVSEYDNIFQKPDCFLATKEIADLISQSNEFSFDWNDDPQNPGIIGRLKLNSDVEIEGVEFLKNQRIQLFTSKRFKLGHLINILEDLKFTILDITNDEKRPGAMFLLQK
jgi:hypothetical protein